MEKINFNGVEYRLNQCEDLFDWIRDSNVGECTFYYTKILFHTEDGFIAAHGDDLSNWIYF